MPIEHDDPQAAAEKRRKLEALKAKKWPPEGKAERVRKALKALEGPVPTFKLTPEQWKQIAEDPDLEG